MVFLPFVSAFSIANRGGGTGWAVRDVRWQKHLPGTPMSNHDTHTMANDRPVGHIASQWEQTQVPTGQMAPSMGAIVPAMTFEGWQNALEKSRPVNI